LVASLTEGERQLLISLLEKIQHQLSAVRSEEHRASKVA
jgi:hypothetical protein